MSLFLACQPIWAAGPTEPSIFENTLALVLFGVMGLLLLIIAILANKLVGHALFKTRVRNKLKNAAPSTGSVLAIILFLFSSSVFAQDATTGTTTDPIATGVKTIGGLSVTSFYVMMAVIILEIFTITALLINMKFLAKTEKEKALAATDPSMLRLRPSWWNRINKFKPVEQEADLDLGHDYDGIRELDNRLPPWWIYGFYLTIIFAAVYLWRFHVSHTGPSSVQEYERSMARADAKIKALLQAKGEIIDENTVQVLSSTVDLAEGKNIFMKSCASCHKEAGGGDVGPNLTDEYWIHGGDVKSIFKTIRYGINAMPQWQNAYSNKQIAQVTSYIKSLKGTNPPNPKAPQGQLYKETDTVKPAIDSTTANENKVVMN
ncbi:MAG TPA: cbb3-type cytochrome c oxidase N-terminal domain-containing protein [Chitinophagaceae bacterium]|nr:cbb3-type cytochrome c oxidase N-terminal domain-containing protein [Chitinophagaceae bacterium]